MTDRKPRLSPKVPTRAIDRKLDRTHVGTSDEAIVAMIEEAIASSPDLGLFTKAIRRQTIAYALWRHRQNRALYVAVATGRLS